jgi:non-ribosomal peptide synthetase-like protein
MALPIFWLYSNLAPWEILLMTPPVYLATNLIHFCFVLTWKWIIIGRFEEGSYPFYGIFHCKWTSWIFVLNSSDTFASSLSGTIFANWFCRALGSTIGNDVVISEFPCMTRETDLVAIGDETCLNNRALLSCHTVENMVLKLASAKSGKRCTLGALAVLMPGSEMEDDSRLLELSQVLKGEAVHTGETWAGLPASRNIEPLSVAFGHNKMSRQSHPQISNKVNIRLLVVVALGLFSLLMNFLFLLFSSSSNP